MEVKDVYKPSNIFFLLMENFCKKSLRNCRYQVNEITEIIHTHTKKKRPEYGLLMAILF